MVNPKISIGLPSKDCINCASSGLGYVGINGIKLKVYLLEGIM